MLDLRFTRSPISGLFALCALAGAATLANGAGGDEGQGTAKPGSRIEELRAGTHLYGAPFDPRATLGKVVVVEIGGS